MSRTQGFLHGNAFSRSAARILIADDGCGGCVALRSGRTRAPLVGESGGSRSDVGVVGSRRVMVQCFLSSEHSTETKYDIVPYSEHCLNPELSLFFE